MVYIISKNTFGKYGIRDIQTNSCWTGCEAEDYAIIPDNLVEGILATKGFCDIVLNAEGTEVVSFTPRDIPSVEKETEWMNPPMELGVEYRTTERCEGKPVYVKRIDLGNLPNAGEKKVAHGISSGATFVSLEVTAYREGTTLFQTFPFITTEGNLRGRVHLNYEFVNINTFSDISNYTAKATLRYTK
jgi:hypothetical protein